jgi:hypothetical protein
LITVEPDWRARAALVTIYDISGRRVKTFNRSGTHLLWDRRNDRGVLVRSGVYFCCVESNTTSVMRKFILF